MRKQRAIAPLLAMVAGISLGAGSASASLLTYEPFNYTPPGDPIVGQVNTTSANSPVSWVENTTYTSSYPVHAINSGNLSAPSGFSPSVGNSADLLAAAQPDWNDLALPNQYGPNTTLYYSVLVKIDDLTGLTIPNSNVEANNDGLVMFGALDTSNAASPTNLTRNWAGELVIRQGSTSGTYDLGVRASSTLAKHDSQYTAFSGDLTANSDTHLVVVGYTQGSDPTSLTYGFNELWIDPDPSTFGNALAPTGIGSGYVGGVGGSPSVTTPTQTVIGNIQIGSGIASGSTPNNAYVDELRVGTTWADVTPAVPEPASVALLGIGALGLLRKRRRRA